MQENILSNRWYDRGPKMVEVLELIESLSQIEQEELGTTLIQLVNILRKNRKEDEIPISIGKNRVLGLYKSSNKRRWYDRNPVLMSAMNVLSTLPVDDCNIILEGMLLTLDDQD
ncbi:MAG: hypothetical protein A2287_06505 [Candidatus Melainabacteria bacterium RIFOXYA12_FULL_32_12]|nr:MAG: hypothetical protein A2104_08770 [Candidatus Melainabacteria bacterium GWF2_32_7]OGI22952.1 MAG: hypothetical protein A2255_06065 [Candidatus Melainabacteria bacterium RIFOXYA2_FULL_32_9]OGI26863.1 MAG: hypothetical protein A2287_06505 [Candidatus Melainabacteria bacterium RIFOXYA12_FULL_32_12]